MLELTGYGIVDLAIWAGFLRCVWTAVDYLDEQKRRADHERSFRRRR